MKTKQLTIILFIFISLFTYSSCTKDGDIPDTVEDSKVTAKIDGQTFESNAAIGGINPDGIFSIFGTEDETIEEDFSGVFISLFHDSEMPIEEGTYNSIDFDCLNSSDICGVIGFGLQGETVEYISAREGAAANISITSIDYQSGGHAIGTFSGTLINDDDEDNILTLTITEGRFSVKIQ